MHPDVKKKIWGVFLILFSIYGAYAFTTATPNIVDRFIGKGALTFLFGNVTTMFCLYGIVTGVMLFLDQWQYYRKTMGLVALMVFNFNIGFSLGTPKLLDYTMVDLFSLASIGGYGGIFGNVFAFVLSTVIGIGGTIALLVILFLVEAFFLFKFLCPKGYAYLKDRSFGMDKIKEKAAK